MSTSRRLIIGLVGLLATASLAPGAAHAVPPGGASADTPGTASSVSPQVVGPGQDLTFRVTGFPAGETVYVKIDDGDGYSDTTTAGSGVVHQQAIDASGTVEGSFRLPETIAEGDHWLRFLASEPIVDAAGKQAGVRGFTLRAGSDFTVASDAEAARAEAAPAAPTASAPTAEAAAAEQPSTSEQTAASDADSSDNASLLVWIAIGVAAVVVGIGGGALMARRGRRPASTPEQ